MGHPHPHLGARLANAAGAARDHHDLAPQGKVRRLKRPRDDGDEQQRAADADERADERRVVHHRAGGVPV